MRLVLSIGLVLIAITVPGVVRCSSGVSDVPSVRTGPWRSTDFRSETSASADSNGLPDIHTGPGNLDVPNGMSVASPTANAPNASPRPADTVPLSCLTDLSLSGAARPPALPHLAPSIMRPHSSVMMD